VLDVARATQDRDRQACRLCKETATAGAMRLMTMTGSNRMREWGPGTRRLVLAAAVVLGTGCLQASASAQESARESARESAKEGVFQKAVNYVFTGKVDPKPGVEIVDPKACVVVMRDRKFKRYIRYYLKRFKMDVALFTKKYSGSRVFHELHVKGDDIVIEYLDPDRTTVRQAYRTAKIALPGDIEQTRKALNIIFTGPCKPEKEQAPF
jgi:hypothetical protein